MVKALVFVLMVFSLSANSADFPVAQNAQFHGFDLNGKIINPKCINLLQPWISDRGIIIRSDCSRLLPDK